MTQASSIIIDNIELGLSHPVEANLIWKGRDDLIRQVLAAWLIVSPEDYPLHPRLVGKPGVGKTTLAYAAARKCGQEIYLMQATMDTRPEDLLILPVVGDSGHLRYVASPLVTAMIRGGICILDEGNRMSEKSWASLAPLLDNRRYIESVIAGITLHAHPDFRFCTTMNDDASTFDIPEYINSRLQPQILVDFPDEEEERQILQSNLPFADDEILEYVLQFLRRAHAMDQRYSVRDGINIARYAVKLKTLPISTGYLSMAEYVGTAIQQILGHEALYLLP